jgi:dGTPase
VITRFVEDVIAESERRLAALAPTDAGAIRRASEPVIAFSPAIATADRQIKAFLYPNMYRHPRVGEIRAKAAQVVRDLFARFSATPETMPGDWAAGCEALDEARRARRIADYIAGMTDWYALDEHRRLFDATPSLR